MVENIIKNGIDKETGGGEKQRGMWRKMGSQRVVEKAELYR